MKLDEPIIGLNYLDELPCNDLQAGPRYTCKLCHQNANLPEMVRHVIGRKHRQKYVELKRPDLVTWNKQSIITHGGKIIRARAEIIERQDGRGTPTQMAKRGIEGKLNLSRVHQRQKQHRGRSISQSSTQRDVPSHLPELKDYQDEYSHPGRYHPNKPPFHPEDPYTLNRDRSMYHQEHPRSSDRIKEELWRDNYRESDIDRRKYLDPDYRTEYKEEYVKDPQRRAGRETGGVPRYVSREEMPHGQAQHGESYPEEAPPYRRPYPERDQLTEFFNEEGRHGRICSAEYQPSQLVFSEGDEQRWSLDREPGRHDSMIRASREGSSEPEAKRRSFPTPTESDRSRDHLFNLLNDYCHEMGEPREEAVANRGPSRTGPPTSQRREEATRAISDIPEPFRRFLKGSAKNAGRSQRKRKSRFSDATVEEVETTKEIFSDEYGPPNPKSGSHPRPVSVPVGPEMHGTQHPDFYMESQRPHHNESYQRGGSEPRDIFDMLKNVEIENADEANFLKSKLCNLLKEFKTKKSENSLQNSHGRKAFSKDNSLNPDPELSPRHQYDTSLPREDSDIRRPDEHYFKEDHRGRGWQQRENVTDEWLQDYHHPFRGESRQSNRSRHEEVFGWPGISQPPDTTNSNEPARYPKRFQEPMHPRDYPPAAEEFLDSHSSPPWHYMERGHGMDRGPRYSNNLEKITSTLLELVARK
ncbi:uncharacterized protein si:ch211-13c6.2 isoform X2 [Etheostoma cragini]|nr:uncharacterized protein si:ch211-13c6.2 isoform X2 [Etheostoma cragini]